MRRSRVAVLLVSVVSSLIALGGTAQAEPPACTGEPTSIQTLNITVGGVPTYGYYSLPATTPKGIVVLGHGYPTTAQSMVPLMPGIAQRDGVIVVAMDYHGTVDLEGPTGNSSRGWKVSEGAADSIAATRLFNSTCQSLNPTRFVNSAFGVSMGGNMTGLAVSEHATRTDGSPLFDYWFDVAGVTNVPEIYTDATAISLLPLGGIQTTGANAKADIEAEMGSPILNLTTYLNRSPVLRASQMKSSGLKGVVVSHGVLDGEVTSDQSDQMVATLALAGIPTDYYTSVFKAPETPPGLTLDGDVLGLIPGYVSPFAGHVNAIVLESALGRLDALYQSGTAPSGLKVTLADGTLGIIPLL
ncbi:MAG TPA: prolyl oligopeptidase family serine peptidase [Solirubrobacterales bacterium]|nr:prolyl oligopeptidase family serine peptidase [Solirubrobacterales bacterium]